MTENRRVLDAKNLSVEIEVPSGTLHAVTDVSLHVDKGETLGIVGESGCGKSITSLAIMNLLPSKATRTASRLQLEGKDLLSLSSTRTIVSVSTPAVGRFTSANDDCYDLNVRTQSCHSR